MSGDEIGVIYGKLETLNAKLDHLTDLFNRAAHGEGFVRCARHSARLKHAEESIALGHVRISGVKKWLLAALVGAAGVLANFAWDIIYSSIRN